MVIAYFDPLRSLVAPDETDSVLVVDTDAVLPFSVPVERLQAVPRWDPQRLKRDHGVQLVELALRDSPQLLGARPSCRFGTAPVEDIFRPPVIERPNHPAPTSVCGVRL